MRSRFITTLRSLAKNIIEIVRDYPVTMSGIILAAFFDAVKIWDGPITIGHSDSLEKLVLFFLLLSVQSIFFEELFDDKPLIRYAGYIVSSVISVFSVYILLSGDDLLFGISAEAFRELLTRFLAVYLFFMLGFSLYHIYKRIGEDFEIFCTKAFLALCKVSVIYGLFAIGLAVIVFILDELIFDTGNLILSLELFLAGGIYTAMCLKAVTRKNEDPGRFAGICVLYVLQPMLLIAFAIIYIYIIKIFVTDSVPSNMVFNILAFLFIIGMPIWTMIHGISKEGTVLRKISFFIPYLFVPFIALQAWSMGIRIRDYGFTVSRYAAVILMICEAIYFILYLIFRRTGKQTLSLIIFFLMATSAFALVIPGTSYVDVVISSQLHRMQGFISDKKPSELNEGEKAAVKSAYDVMLGVSYKGRAELEKRFPQATLADIDGFNSFGSSRPDLLFVYSDDAGTTIDISYYDTLYKVGGIEEVTGKGTLYTINIYEDDGMVPYKQYTVDLADLITRIGKDIKGRDTSDFSLKGNEIQKIDENTDLYITHLSLDYDKALKRAENLNIDGYILERR
ncbi:MAG: DUF4153 domain-containing protein [Lachnospiraceae bacterium]|nr:DUF4153 domain-containing protein [Lachnospiraceae bacterium]